MAEDYVLDSRNITRHVSEFPIEVTITLINDEIAESNEKFEVSFSIQELEGVIQGNNVVSITLLDDDSEYVWLKLVIRIMYNV